MYRTYTISTNELKMITFYCLVQFTGQCDFVNLHSSEIYSFWETNENMHASDG